jgi:hypothetical protein
MTEPLTLPTATKLAQTKSKETLPMKNTIPNLTIIYYSKTSEERNRTADDKHKPSPKLHILNRHD